MQVASFPPAVRELLLKQRDRGGGEDDEQQDYRAGAGERFAAAVARGRISADVLMPV